MLEMAQAKDDYSRARAFKKYEKSMSAVDKYPWVDIESSSAGESFHEGTLEEFRNRLLALRDEGLSFPEYVLRDVEEEIMERVKDARSV